MNHSEHNPTRRNRNIGTAKQGHGQNNRDAIPRLWKDSQLHWARNPSHTVVLRHVWGRPLPFMVEHTYEDCFHACTVDDVTRVLNMLPKNDVNNSALLSGIRGIVLRQPTRKENKLGSVWGRLAYGVDVVCKGIKASSGPVIYLDAQAPPVVLRWPKSLHPEGQLELKRRSQFATRVDTDRREHRLEFDLAAVRETQLYHTLPHEVGHWADMLEKVERPWLIDELNNVHGSEEDDEYMSNWAKLWDSYFQRPSREREAFAHRYADEQRAHLMSLGKLPYPRQFDAQAMRAEGLRLEDFDPSQRP